MNNVIYLCTVWIVLDRGSIGTRNITNHNDHVSANISATINAAHLNRDANFSICSWGHPVSKDCTRNNTCDDGYQCDTAIKRCCLSKRRILRNLGICSWGQAAVSACFFGVTCNLGYRCDITINRCCLPTPLIGPPSTNWGVCSWGKPAVGPCFGNGQCNLGYQCDIRINRCCLPNLGGNLGVCSWGQPAISFCRTGYICSNIGYICDTITNRCCLPGKGSVSNNLGLCTWGQPAASACLPGNTCGLSYICDVALNLCCLPNVAPNLPQPIVPPPIIPVAPQLGLCSWGQPALEFCQFGYTCSIAGYICDTVTNRCCLPNANPNNAVPHCTWGEPGISACAPGGTCNYGGYCDVVTNLCCLQSWTAGNMNTCPFGASSNGMTCNQANPFCTDQTYACMNNICCQITGMRCNNGYVPTGLCIVGQCPQYTPAGLYQPQICEPRPYNFCCPI